MVSDFWPHQFTKTGTPKQIGEQQIYNGTKVPIMAQEMICVHCHTRYLQGRDPQPAPPCPARNTKREMKRILNR